MSMINRRRLVQGAAGVAAAGKFASRTSAQGADPIAYSYPIGDPGKALGDGFWPRHGYACENTRYYPGLWHTGENWYRIEDRMTAGAAVYAVSNGEIVYAGFDYPGPVVILHHTDGLYSMYGHLDYDLAVEVGDQLVRGQQIGTVLKRTDDPGRSHLHFEIRTFLTKPEVNGNSPLYSFACGPNCPPGPGYWPMNVDHPSAVGWRNPTHVIAKRMFAGERPPEGSELVVADGAEPTIKVWNEPADHADAQSLGDLDVNPGDRFSLLAVATGAEASEETSAEAYRLWYRVRLRDSGRVWVQSAVPSTNDTGADGRATSVRLLLFSETAGPSTPGS